MPAFPPAHPYWGLKQALIARTGHHYYEDKDEVLWDRLRRRMSALGLTDLAAYLRRLDDPETGPAEWRRLEGEITVGETYFLRYVEQFTALRETILPALIEARDGVRRLRIWSAGCSTGAEPFSVAILLHELLGEALPDWRISILGTDINEAALERARDGLFGAWALRSLSADQKAGWFTPEGREHRLKRPYRSLVRFQHANLLDLLGRDAPLELTEFDLILCRNVLIYFRHDVVAALVGALGERLTAEGWLLLGHAEPNPAFEGALRAELVAGATAYRRRDASQVSDQAPPPWEPLTPPSASASLPTPARPPAPLPPQAQQPQPERGASDPAPETLETVRRLANAGAFEAAAAACRSGLDRQPESAILHFYGGLIAQAQGRAAEAEDALRRAVYLDQAFVMAQYHLGLVRLERGQKAAGRKALAAAAAMAANLSPTSRLCEGEGLTAADLRELARLQLENGA